VPTANPASEPLNRRVEITLDQVVYTGNVNVFRDPFNGGLGHDGVDETSSRPDRANRAAGSADARHPDGPVDGRRPQRRQHDGRMYVAFNDQADATAIPNAANATDHDDTDIFVLASTITA